MISRLSLGHIAEGATFAEEVISTIRTAQAFGTQKTLSDLYDQRVYPAFQADMKAATWNGAGLGLFFFIMYSAYGLGESSLSSYLRVTRYQPSDLS